MKHRVMLAVWFLVGGRAGLAQLPPVPTTDAKAIKQPRLYVAERMKDLGTLIEGDVYPVQWQLENRGSADLMIQRLKGSCGCVVANLSENEKIIPPGGSIDLKVNFDTQGRKGAQVKAVTVYTNDPAEPELKLEFTADLQFLYMLKPFGVVNLRSVQRGQPAKRALEVFSGPGRGPVEILDVQFPEGSPVTSVIEPGDDDGGRYKRIRFTVGKEASLGTLYVPLTLVIRVDGIERKREVSVRAEVVGELTWHPRIVDQIRSVSRPGKRLAPVTIRSTVDIPFKVVSADAGPLFDVVIEAKGNKPQHKQYSILLTLREGTDAGPFAVTLNVRTDSLDQPLIRIPVFGVVAPALAIDPPIILLRSDGTPAGVRRRVKLQSSPQQELVITGITCDSQWVSAVVDKTAEASRRHVRFLEVSLHVESLKRGSGEHRATLSVTTNIPGAERIEIPIVVDTSG